MLPELLQALKEKGWPASLVASRTGISLDKLICNNVTKKELDKVLHLADIEAGIDLDELEGEE